MFKGSQIQPAVWLLIPVLLLVVWLTAPHLKGAFWVDEVITVERAGSPEAGGPFSPAQIWERTATVTYDQVPGYFWLVGAWDNLLGWSEFSTRLLSLMAGLLAVAVTYRLGCDLHSTTAGISAAVAVASSAYFIYYLHEARVYALSVLLGVLTIWLYWRVVRQRGGWLAQAALALSAAAVLYAHYFASLLIFSICLYHLLFVPKSRDWWRVVVLLGLAGALFLPWFLTSFDAVQGANTETWRHELSQNVVGILNTLLNAFANGGVVVLIVLGALALQRQRYVWWLVVVPIALALVVNVWLKMLVSSKFLLYMWTPLALVFGIGVARLELRGLRPALLLIPWVLVGAWTSLNWQEVPVEYVEWAVLRDQLTEQVRADDAIVYHVVAGAWDGQHELIAPYYFHDQPVIPELLVSWPHDSDARYLETLNVTGKQRVWSAYEERPARMTAFEAAMLEDGFANCGSAAQDPAMSVDLFARPPEEMLYRFGGDLYDEGIAMTPLGAIDSRRWIPLGWQIGEDVPLNTYSFAVHVLDSNGALVAQVDTGLPPDFAFGCTVIQLPTLPPGAYEASLVVYAWETGERLQAPGDGVSLGTFTVGG